MPLTNAELERLARKEGERCEFKKSLSDRAKIKHAICAFANDLTNHRSPSVIFVGLRDDGSCCGLEITDERPKLAADFRSDGRQPHFSMKIGLKHFSIPKRNRRLSMIA
ncbi:MAG: hypothetical protein CHACPFDD_03253 [Phycisphaerae bacterium]|nr:hypothetical protein [Phycisphaerae bacterium]